VEAEYSLPLEAIKPWAQDPFFPEKVESLVTSLGTGHFSVKTNLGRRFYGDRKMF
jgi:hypothetical protein